LMACESSTTAQRRRDGRLWSRRALIAGLVGVAALVALLAGCHQSDAIGGSEGTIWRPDDVEADEIDMGRDGDSGSDDADDAIEVDVPREPDPTGAACGSSRTCDGDRCLSGEFPGGYCSRTGCDDGRGCSGTDAACVQLDDLGSICVDGCTRNSDCRDGYQCLLVEPNGVWGCLPEGRRRGPEFSGTRQVLDFRCEPRVVSQQADSTTYAFDFQLDQGVDGFLAVPLTLSGEIRPISLETPSQTLDLVEGYRHHNTPATFQLDPAELTGFGTFGRVSMEWPILVPYAPKHQELVEPGGAYTIQIRSRSPESPCFYLLQNRGRPTLDLNVYIVGSDPMSDETAATNPDLSEVLSRTQTLLGRGSIELGEIRFPAVSEAVVQEFSRVTTRLDALRLMAYGRPPDDTRDGHLSIDVFMVEDLAFDGEGAASVLGLSAGLPGSAGMHGNARNGVIMQTTDLGFDNDHVAHILAHELGHFLGLRHTTEASHDTSNAPQVERVLGTTDPIDDTAVCDDIADKLVRSPSDCGDYDNLMFPMAPPPGSDAEPRLTEGQSTVLSRNPLVKQ